MLNEIISVDLHIHSYASKYKETNGIVDNSTKENLDVLFQKLQDNKINLFSITDHNRFDSELYLEAKAILESGVYTEVKEILAGVEFDVKLEEEQKSCHILTYFEINDYKKDYIHISNKIEEKLLTNKTEYYSKEQLEDLLKSIGLNTILIACQRKSLDNGNGNHNSLSDSTRNPYDYIKVGYVDALEYQKPKVEGILINNLKEFDKSIGLICGSDCHEWAVYPNHDSKQVKLEAYYSNIKILPSYKGLLMALTSPNTRFNRSETKNSNYINEIKLNNKDVFLSNGINAVIGENGSGKSSLLKIMIGNCKESHVNKIKEANSIITKSINLSRTKIIPQADIINKFNKSSLFSESENLFVQIDNTKFEKLIDEYSSSLYEYVMHNIKVKDFINSLIDSAVKIEDKYESIEKPPYYIIISSSNDFSNIDNPHIERAQKLENIITLLQDEIDTKYYSTEDIQVLNSSLSNLKTLYEKINKLSKIVKAESSVKNIIVNKIMTYNSNINELKTSQDKEKDIYINKKKTIKDNVVKAIKFNIIEKNVKDFPPPISGYSDNETNGFIFKKVAFYNNAELKQEFFKIMFNVSVKSTGTFTAKI